MSNIDYEELSNTLQQYLKKSDHQLIDTKVILKSNSYHDAIAEKEIAELILMERRVDEITKSLKQLDSTIQESSDASSKLGQKVLWLNRILAFCAFTAIVISMIELLTKP